MNIALINQWYSPEDTGGIATYNYYMATAYKDLGHNVFVICKLKKRRKRCERKKGINSYGVKQLTTPWFFTNLLFVGGFLRFLRDLFYSFSVRRQLIKLNKKHTIDIVEYAEINSEGFAHSIFGPKKIPFVVRCHTPYFVLKDYYLKRERIFDNSFIYWMEKIFIRKAPALTAPSKDLAKIISSRLRISNRKIIVTPNVINIGEFSPKKTVNENRQEIILLYVGRIERAKGIFVLANALGEFVKIYGNRIKCTIVGPGQKSIKDEIIFYFSQKDISINIEFKGKVPERELLAIYQQCDIFINPSLIYESFSYTCLEAMACGKPVVASRLGGIPEVVKDKETGFLFETGNADDLREKLSILLEDASLRRVMGEKGRLRVENKFNSISVAKKNIEIYENVRNWQNYSGAL
jgi:glycosyltransferase involved in cell wall biosynthesis